MATPEFPEGTPEYTAYRAELQIELDKFARGEDPYPYTPTDPDEQYLAMAAHLARAHAGGWSPDSIPGAKALEEFEAFVRETQARTMEAFLAWWRSDEWSADLPWWVESRAESYAADIRAGRTDRAGKRR